MSGSLVKKSNDTIVDQKSRGIPSGVGSFALKDAGRFGWVLPNEDLCLPALTLSKPAMRNNLAVMEKYATEQGIFLCPHGKTMMAPQLFAELLDGERTVGLSAATVAQANVMVATGAPIVLIANQIVGKANIAAFADLISAYPDTEFLLLIESVAAFEMLVQHGADRLPKGKSFNLLVEVGYPDARTGIQSTKELTSVIAAVKNQQNIGAPVAVRGLEAYEGAIGGKHSERVEKIADYLDFAVRAYNLLAESGVLTETKQPIFTAGGSSTFDLVVSAFQSAEFDIQPQLWLRGGVSAIFDHLIYRERMAEMDARGGFKLAGLPVSAGKTFRPALAIWAAVQALPRPGLAILAAGIRDFPYDAGLPISLAQYRNGRLVHSFGASDMNPIITKANDQHSFLEFPEELVVCVGDVFKLGLSHPCTAFDKWRFVFCVDENERVVQMVETFF